MPRIGMTYIGVKVPHHILKRAYKKYQGKKINYERDEILWENAYDWVNKMNNGESLSKDNLPRKINMSSMLKAIEDIHGRDEEDKHFDVVDITEYIEDSKQGPTQICISLWSHAEELSRKESGYLFSSFLFDDVKEEIRNNKDKMNELLDNLNIPEDEFPRDIELITGVSSNN
jgi:hypothetical protein